MIMQGICKADAVLPSEVKVTPKWCNHINTSTYTWAGTTRSGAKADEAITANLKGKSLMND